VVIGFPPGGFVDLTARLVGGPLGSALGQQVVVENRGGAGGIVGTEIVARAAPDGYTLTVGSAGTHAVNQSLYRKLPYNVLRDFQPITRLSDAPSILAVHPSFPVRSVKELIGVARGRPGEVMYASAGSGTSTHLAAALFEHLARVKLVHVPYKGGGPAIADLIGGQVKVHFNTPGTLLPHVKAGRLRALAMSSAKRADFAPDIPTVAESGVPGYEATVWYGVYGPKTLPPRLLQRWSETISAHMKTPQAQAHLRNTYMIGGIGTPGEFADFHKRESERWTAVIKSARIEPQ
jgi:tripartite-type tricarboxylate transporter receptor subunit TctC